MWSQFMIQAARTGSNKAKNWEAEVPAVTVGTLQGQENLPLRPSLQLRSQRRPSVICSLACVESDFHIF